MLVKIFKLGEEEAVTTFASGLHVLGRGPALQCNDKRVSRNHASIEITENDVKLTSTHINPCFLRAADSKTITILSQNSSSQLNDSDTFALLPEDFWFKIKIVEENILDTEGVKSEEVSKRCLDDSENDAPPDKRAKTEENDNHTITSETNNLRITEPDEPDGNKIDEPEANNVPIEEADRNKDPENKKADENKDPENGETYKNEVPEDVPKNNEQEEAAVPASQSNDDEKPSGSNPRPRREKCWYAAQCYRKNPVHRQEYKHPGDSDFESDPDDDRPTCSFGAQCYRKNKLHRRDYKHPPREPPSKKKRARKKVDRLNVADSEEMRGLSDSEDPFLADDDSDEYLGESDDDDSDWEDSQNVDEDSENVKRLMKEANRFVKK